MCFPRASEFRPGQGTIREARWEDCRPSIAQRQAGSLLSSWPPFARCFLISSRNTHSWALLPKSLAV